MTLIALATEKRLQKLIHLMILASKHRVDSQTFTQPTMDEKGQHPFKIVDVQDIKKQLLAIERVEREEERKRKEAILERERKAQLGEDAGEAGDEDGKPAKKKKKKEMGPGVTARYMSDDVRNKTTNETALMIAGGVMKSWMLTGMNSGAKEKSVTPQPLSRQNSNPVNNTTIESFSTTATATPNNNLTSPITNTNTMPFSATSPPNTTMFVTDTNTNQQLTDDQPRGRGRPRRRKSGSGPDIMSGGGKKAKGFMGRGTSTLPVPGGGSINQESGLFLPPSTIGRSHHRLGEQGARKITVRDALYVLEDEYENKMESARRTLVKAYANYLK
jgi:hypothetical protein